MTAPTAPQQPTQTASQRDRQVIAGIAAVLAAGAAASVAMATLTKLLAPLRISPAAARGAYQVAVRVTGEGSRPTVAGPAEKLTAAGQNTYRAAYILAAARRINVAVSAANGDPAAQRTALAAALQAESRYAAMQVQAQNNRLASARAVDVASARVGKATPDGRMLGWKARMDDRTSAECAAANGRNFPADRPPRIGWPGAVHPHCFPAGTVVVSPGTRATTTRWYSGEICEITTSRGDVLTVTPNHPVLTGQGWVAAGLLDERSEVVSTRFAEALTRLVDPDNCERPAFIEDVARSFGEGRGVLAAAVPVTPVDFHGDGADSQVAVVRAYGMLRDGFVATQAHPCVIKQLGRDGGPYPMPSPRSLDQFLGRRDATSCGYMRRLRVARILLRRAAGHHQPIGFQDSTNWDVARFQNPANTVTRQAVRPGQLSFADARDIGIANVGLGQHRLGLSRGLAPVTNEIVGRSAVAVGPALDQRRLQQSPANVELVGGGVIADVAALVELDRVVKVRRWASWTGHVFNLETSAGWYVSDNILAHNCRCVPTRPYAGAGLVDDIPAKQEAA